MTLDDAVLWLDRKMHCLDDWLMRICGIPESEPWPAWLLDGIKKLDLPKPDERLRSEGWQ